MSEDFTVRLDFETSGYMIIKRFHDENNKDFLKRINRILKIFMQEQPQPKEEKK